jgi:hypothetical protein
VLTLGMAGSGDGQHVVAQPADQQGHVIGQGDSPRRRPSGANRNSSGKPSS